MRKSHAALLAIAAVLLLAAIAVGNGSAAKPAPDQGWTWCEGAEC